MKTLALLLIATTPVFGQVPYERIRDAASEPESWLTYSGTYGAQRYSTLDLIDRNNIAHLQPAWIYQTRSLQKFEVSPLVADGVMYISEPPSDATALDLRTGRPIWRYRRSLPQGIVTCCGQVNRGVALLDDQVFLGTVDAHLVALDAETGHVRWDIEVADYSMGYSITVAPLALKDKIIVGIAGGEYGIRGFLDAYDPTTGERLWRFWTVPGPGEPGHETWSGDSWMRGGAPTWVTGAYDPELDLLYWGTGNPGPDFIGEVRLGDNLFSESLIALDPDTGELQWYFQFLPHDIHDYDSTQVPVLVDTLFQGKARKLLLFPNRNGFYYALDRVTGEFLLGTPFARQTWALGLDDDGRPIEDPTTIPSADGARVYPDDDGAANWYSPTYSPQTGLIYQNVREKGGIYYLADATYEPGRIYMGASRRVVPGEDPQGFLRALDAVTGERVWEIELQSPPWAGLMTTAGGVVFSGTMEGDFFAADARTGDVLWRFQTGGAVYANPITYLSEGRQFVAIAAGNALITFALEP
ncbi:MAG: PQQ-dependent dehydrogenase, methanol/ethanol family [Acidobacteriota bacterium]|nr:PQQ-dependent dehydrogenase, methanol/ethanol family [Acidobacteriota bacterium]